MYYICITYTCIYISYHRGQDLSCGTRFCGNRKLGFSEVQYLHTNWICFWQTQNPEFGAIDRQNDSCNAYTGQRSKGILLPKTEWTACSYQFVEIGKTHDRRFEAINLHRACAWSRKSSTIEEQAEFASSGKLNCCKCVPGYEDWGIPASLSTRRSCGEEQQRRPRWLPKQCTCSGINQRTLLHMKCNSGMKETPSYRHTCLDALNGHIAFDWHSYDYLSR